MVVIQFERLVTRARCKLCGKDREELFEVKLTDGIGGLFDPKCLLQLIRMQLDTPAAAKPSAAAQPAASGNNAPKEVSRA